MSRASSSHLSRKSWFVASDLYCFATTPPNGIVAGFKFMPLVVLWFCAWSMRIVMLPALWSTYVPMLSPVFGSGAHWLSSQRLAFAIRVHVLSGVVMLLCGGLQFDKTLRRTCPAVHRWTGRLYVLSGLATVASLQPLRALSGGFAQKGDGASRLMAAFIDVTSLAWALSTGMAVYHAAARRDFVRHRQWAATSLALALTPIVQRVLLVILLPYAMLARMLLDAVLRGVPPWQSAWGAAPATWSGAPAAPRTLSLEGYGVAENALLPYSAWLGLLAALWFAGTVVWSGGEHQLESPDAEQVHSSGDGGAGDGSGSGGGGNTKPTGCSASSILFEFNALEEVQTLLRHGLVRTSPRMSEWALALVQRVRWVIVRPFRGDAELSGRPWKRLAVRCASGAMIVTSTIVAAAAACAAVVANAVVTVVVGGVFTLPQTAIMTFGALAILAVVLVSALLWAALTGAPLEGFAGDVPAFTFPQLAVPST